MGAKLGVHFWLVERYGYHRDELYFIACGQHLAFGYVDHAPVVPWLARLAGSFDHSLLALRMPSILAGGLSILATVLLVRAWGGRTGAQLIAGLAVLSAPAFMRMSKILCIPVFEPLLWTLEALLVTRLIRTGERKLWLAIGAVAGIGLLTKHTMLLWGLGFAVGAVLTPRLRAELRTPFPWLGIAIALAIFAPNLVWQAGHEWATLEFLRNIQATMLAEIPRVLFLGGQLLYMNPLAVPLWVGGLIYLFSGFDGNYRVFGWLFVTVLVVLFVTKAKPYYLAPAYPMLHAAGAIWLEKAVERRRRSWLLAPAAAFLVAASAFAAVITLPIVSLERMDRTLGALLGWAVPPVALTHDLHDEFGWPEQAQTVARVVSTLSPDERASAVIVTGNYGEAAAASFFGARYRLPPAVSGHMNYYLWGPSSRTGDVAIAYGVPAGTLAGLYADVKTVGHIEHPLAHPYEQSLPIYVCRAPIRPLREAWPELKRYSHSGDRPLTTATE